MQTLDWVLVGFMVLLSYVGFSMGFLAGLGGIVGLKAASLASQSDFLRDTVALKFGLTSEIAVTILIFLAVVLAFHLVSKIITASMDFSSVLLWLPNRLVGAVIGLAAAIVIISAGWRWMAPSVSVAVDNSRVAAWALGQDDRFGLSQKLTGVATDVETVEQILDTERPQHDEN